MLDIPSNSRLDRIDAIVREFIKNQPVARAIHADEDLGGLGLTSLDMVNLMLAVEAEFDVTIPGPKLVPANFRSIANIAGLVSQLAH
jgi:acyl carrier protein